MKKQQVILISGALALFMLIYFLGNTIPPKINKSSDAAKDSGLVSLPITTNNLLAKAKSNLNQEQVSRITMLENSVVRGDIKDQQIKVYKQLATFWGDSMHHHELGAYYSGEAAKLENSEKNLTFAAQFLLDSLMACDEPAMQYWLATEAKVLFEKSLEINPANDSAKIAIGACYIFGGISDNPMQGILKIKEVADRDSGNIYAHLILGMGGIKSGQYDKAIEHFLSIVKKEPANLQAIFYLAETYERKGDKPNAIKLYKIAAGIINIPEAKKEIEDKIKSLQ